MAIPISPILASLQECLCAELAATGEQVCFCGVVAGSSVLAEYVSASGVMGWVRLLASYPSRTFPQPDSDLLICGSSTLAYEIEVGIGRCAPIGSATTPPTAEEWWDLADAQAKDIAMMLRAIQCCLRDIDRDYMLGQVDIDGPQGGVLLTAWNVFISDPVL